MLCKTLKLFFAVVLIIITIYIFVLYLIFLFKPYCSRLGYTLCAAIGEDFFALYQATYNFFHNFFIYGEPATTNLVTPYFMIFKYFPITPLLIGWPFLIFFPNVEGAYQGYLLFVLVFFILNGLGMYFLWKRFGVDNLTKIFTFVLWFTYFPILSDLRMGQFNLIASLLFWMSIIFLVYHYQILNIISWIFSLIFKPIALLNIIYYFKTKNKVAINIFILLFVIFTIGYLEYYNLHYPSAISDFLKIIILMPNRIGWQIHYPDNFSINSFIGELLYDFNHRLFFLLSKVYILVLIVLFGIFSWKISLGKDIKTDIYYSLYAFSTLIMYHKEVWESWLSCWLIIIALALILTSRFKEKLFLFINGLILGTPSLFVFYDLHKTNIWRLLLIAEKTIPQILIYAYLIYKICIIIKQALIYRTKGSL